jgi:uncharacterized protein with NAD-binding domain and iron-sulfur cluster
MKVIEPGHLLLYLFLVSGQRVCAAWLTSSRRFLAVKAGGDMHKCKCQCSCKKLLLPLFSSSGIVQNENEMVESTDEIDFATKEQRRKVLIIGAGWGGLSAAHTLSKEQNNLDITIVDASPRVGGLVQDGYKTKSGTRVAEAGIHGFWNNYHNIYDLLRNEIDGFDINSALTDFAEQGQYSPQGLQAVWPVYRDQPISLPTGLAQAAYTRFLNLPLSDLLSAFPMVLAFSDFDDSVKAWERYDHMSFRDLCRQYGVSKRCYDEAFEPMILTGLFAPGEQCSAAAALGMAYFFVLQSQSAFDVRWCRGNIGSVIFDPWIKTLQKAGVRIETNTRVTGFQFKNTTNTSEPMFVASVTCTSNLDGSVKTKQVDDVIFAVGAKALNAFSRYCPELARFPEFRRFANLRGTSVLATRVFLDSNVTVPYSANACWGFDRGIGMTLFDIGALHGPKALDANQGQGSILEVDYYHSSTLLVLSDDEIIAKVKSDLDSILGPTCAAAKVLDAAIVRLPDAVNWYFPGSYCLMPEVKSKDISNVYFAGDIARTRHGSWSQEKAFVTGIEAANRLLGRSNNHGIIRFAPDEPHVQFGRAVVSSLLSGYRLSSPLSSPLLNLQNFNRFLIVLLNPD